MTIDISNAQRIEEIQELWSGYGSIGRYSLNNTKADTIVIKHVQLPDQTSHPRGWNTDLSHQRKIESYIVECCWYQDYNQQCDDNCRTPHCYNTETRNDEFLIVMEDLDRSGFPLRKEVATLNDIKTCLNWLAYFHATFMNTEPNGLWKTGSYWHLATRPDELAALKDIPLKNAAAKIDHALNNCTYLTLVHGDAKLANFCFSTDSKRVAAVDFQYVGGGCGMKDVAYFIGSCLYEEDCERFEDELLDHYFMKLQQALTEKQPELNADDIERSWRPLFAYAWTDFHRFVKGWNPSHWKIHNYSERLAKTVLVKLAENPNNEAF